MAQTWDGKEIAPEAPFGAMVVVYRQGPLGLECLILHRAHQGSAYEGDWAWTPPSGARQPGEPIDDCAVRELYEEAGLHAEPVQVGETPTGDWAIYIAQVGPDAQISLHDEEHDRYEWVSPDEALRRCRPKKVSDGLAQAIEAIRA